MQRKWMEDVCETYTWKSPNNYVGSEKALSTSVIGLRIFDPPLLGVADARDPLFEKMKEASVIGQHFLVPTEWLPQAKSVISFFLPFTKEVRDSNKKIANWPSLEWLHARIEGQAFVLDLCRYLDSILLEAGHTNIIPATDPRFTMNDKPPTFTSNWSERHVAFVAGLGTFSLSKGLITKKGMAGRFGSVITSLELATDKRKYTEIDEYCNHCGVCMENCLVNAISYEQGKKHEPCGAYIDETAVKFSPRYGCGKCQVNVPCEKEIPIKTSELMQTFRQSEINFVEKVR